MQNAENVLSASVPQPRLPTRPVALQSRSVRTAGVLLLLCAGLALHPETRDAFLTPGNLSNITAQVAEILIIGVGMTFVVLTGGIDLSVGAAMAFFAVIAATLQIDHGHLDLREGLGAEAGGKVGHARRRARDEGLEPGRLLDGLGLDVTAHR